MRDKSSLHYFEVHAGFVHHTVNANDYTRAEVPGHPAQHLRLPHAVPRLERHRLQLPGRPVRPDLGGPRTAASTARSSARTPSATTTTRSRCRRSATSRSRSRRQRDARRPTARCSPGSCRCTASTPPRPSSASAPTTSRRSTATATPAATACPGQYLYAKIPQIRRLAAEAQRGWAGPRARVQPRVGTTHPDLVVRRASDGQGFVIPTGGLTRLRQARTVGRRLGPAPTRRGRRPDLTGDGRADLRGARRPTARPTVRPGTGDGGSARPSSRSPALRRPRPDHRGRRPQRGRPQRPGRPRHRDRPARRLPRQRQRRLRSDADSPASWGGYNLLAAAGDLDGDGHVDLLARDRDGDAVAFRRQRRRGPSARRSQVPGIVERLRHDRRRTATSPATAGPTSWSAREPAATATCCPVDGDGTFGHPLGPIDRPRGLGALVGGGHVVGDGTPDVVVRTGGDRRRVPRNPGTVDTAPPDRDRRRT